MGQHTPLPSVRSGAHLIWVSKYWIKAYLLESLCLYDSMHLDGHCRLQLRRVMIVHPHLKIKVPENRVCWHATVSFTRTETCYTAHKQAASRERKSKSTAIDRKIRISGSCHAIGGVRYPGMLCPRSHVKKTKAKYVLFSHLRYEKTARKHACFQRSHALLHLLRGAISSRGFSCGMSNEKIFQTKRAIPLW